MRKGLGRRERDLGMEGGSEGFKEGEEGRIWAGKGNMNEREKV